MSKGKRFYMLPLLLLCGLVTACSNDLEMTVLYDQTNGIQKGDRVFLEAKPIGEVEAIQVHSKGRFAIRLEIEKGFRHMVTDQCRFIIQADPERQDHKAVKVVRLAAGGKSLPDRVKVEGSTSLSVLLERGSREFEDWQKRFEEELDRWKKELDELPEKEWYKRLESMMEEWAEEIERGGEEVRRYFEKEVLPALEEALRELKRRLREGDKQKDAEPLEIKLKKLKRT